MESFSKNNQQQRLVDNQRQRPMNPPMRRSERATIYVVNVPLSSLFKHFLSQCKRFKNSNIDEKTKIIQQTKLCFNCLQSGYCVKTEFVLCTYWICKTYGRKHHTLLLRDNIKMGELKASSTENLKPGKNSLIKNIPLVPSCHKCCNQFAPKICRIVNRSRFKK